jgi:hypothetical protein
MHPSLKALLLVLLCLPPLVWAEDTRQRIFDEKPKTIFYITNSHMGHTQLQDLLKRMGFGHLQVKIIRGHSTYLDFKTGEGSNWSTTEFRKENRPVFVIATVGPRASAEAAKDLEASKGWAIRDNLSELLRTREIAKKNGASEVFFATYHWHPKPGEPGPKPGETVDAPAWVAELNRATGLPLGINALTATHAEFPYTVGKDGYHAGPLANYLRAREMIRAMLAYDGRTDLEIPNLDADRAEARRQRDLIKVKLEPPPPWTVGQEVRITWDTDPEIVDKLVLWVFLAGESGRILDVVPVEPMVYRWSVPASVDFHPDHLDRRPDFQRKDKPLPVVRSGLQIQAHNADGKEFGVSELFEIRASP